MAQCRVHVGDLDTIGVFSSHKRALFDFCTSEESSAVPKVNGCSAANNEDEDDNNGHTNSWASGQRSGMTDA